MSTAASGKFPQNLMTWELNMAVYVLVASEKESVSATVSTRKSHSNQQAMALNAHNPGTQQTSLRNHSARNLFIFNVALRNSKNNRRSSSFKRERGSGINENRFLLSVCLAVFISHHPDQWKSSECIRLDYSSCAVSQLNK